MNRETNKLTYLIFLRKYAVVNYLIVIVEQIALWNWGAMWFFWFALVLNVLGMFGLGHTMNKLEKEIIK